MKKILISVAAAVFVALMIGNAYAQCGCITPPPFCPCMPPGFTPGFWKHNIEVYLGLAKGGKGSFSAFEGGPLNGVKVNAGMLEGFLAAINSALGTSLSFTDVLAILKEPGWSSSRTNLANWFNYEAGYGPYVD